MGDLKSILVDKRGFMNPRLEYRLRFSVAHEIGHLILHHDIYGGLKHASAKEWFDYISAITIPKACGALGTSEDMAQETFITANLRWRAD